MLCRTADSLAQATSAWPSRTTTEAEPLDYTAAPQALSELTARAGRAPKDVAGAAGAGAGSGAQIMRALCAPKDVASPARAGAEGSGAQIALGLRAAIVRAYAVMRAMYPEATQARRDRAPCHDSGTIGDRRAGATRASVRPAPRTHKTGHTGWAAIQHAT
jgi:hypothetical protein